MSRNTDMIHQPGEHPGDWPEDFPHDNGCYMNRCCGCGLIFHGHKRRNQCKVCASSPPQGGTEPIATAGVGGNRCGCSYWLTKPCPSRNCPWKGKRPIDVVLEVPRG